MCINGKVVKVHKNVPVTYPIRAYRAWRVNDWGNGPVLGTTFSPRNPWGKAKNEYRAHHTPGQYQLNDTGIHAKKNLKEVKKGFKDYNHIYGIISLSGRVVEHVNGYRAQVARIEKIYVPERLYHLVDGLKKNYPNVKVVRLSRPKAVLNVC